MRWRRVRLPAGLIEAAEEGPRPFAAVSPVMTTLAPRRGETPVTVTDRVRAELYDEKGSVKGSFTQLRYNTQNGRIEETQGFRTTVRK